MAEKFLFFVFFNTPYNTGKFIRKMTKFPYNHSAVSLSSDMSEIYSFSRHHKPAAFYAGFTKESILRYRNKGETAAMKICAVPVSEEQFSKAKERIEYLRKNWEDTLYNIISASFFLSEKRIKIRNAYTCVEFVLETLKNYTDVPEVKNRDFCSIKELCKILDKYTVYEGSAEKFFEGASWEGDRFLEENRRLFLFGKTLSNNAKLILRLIKREK